MSSYKSIPRLSKYEYSMAISKRATEIYNHSLSTIKNNSIDPVEIAKKEYIQRKLPIKIKRKIGRTTDVFNINHMKYFYQDQEHDENYSFSSDESSNSDEWDHEYDHESTNDDQPIPLTNEQIQDIVSNIKFMNTKNDYILSIEAREKQKLENQLRNIQIKPSVFQEFKNQILSHFYKTIISAGEAVGVNASQCIGEPVTQGTLNTFHSCGISKSNVTLGFARASELFNATSNPKKPLSFVYFNKYNQNLEQLHNVIDPIQQILISDIVIQYNIIHQDTILKSNTPSNFQKDTIQWLDLYETIYTPIDFNENMWHIHFYLDKKKLFNNNITLKSLRSKIYNEYNDIQVHISPLQFCEIIVSIDCQSIQLSKVDTQEELNDIQSTYELQKYFVEKVFLLEIQSIMINGIWGYTDIIPQKINSKDYGIALKPSIQQKLDENEDQWMIETTGSNLEALFELPFIDKRRTYTNDFMEMYKIYGIEGARTFLFFEFTNIIQASGGYINPRHIELLVDKMTSSGTIRAISRNGIDTTQYEPISRASFEEVMKHLIISASFSEIDHLKGISNNIALGKSIRAGTGYVDYEYIPIQKKKTN